jgi:ubiquinone/menaquinone biosynthesis C-methylase UbiE
LRFSETALQTATTRKWPKHVPPLTPEQQRISDDFMRYWHEEVLPQRYGTVERFNHGYVVRRAPKGFRRTLEIGAGLGEHLDAERLTDEQQSNYYAVDIRENMASDIRRRFPKANAIVADCQQRLDFPDGYFDRIIAIHVLEHLPDLPAAVRELYRVCDKAIGTFSIVIPCEGGLAYSVARMISSKRMFEKRYGQPYEWFIKREHINVPREIFEEIDPYFERRESTYFPLPVGFEFCNICIGATFAPRPSPLRA